MPLNGGVEMVGGSTAPRRPKKGEEDEDIGISSAYTHLSESHYQEIKTLIARIPEAAKKHNSKAPNQEMERIFERFVYLLNLYQEQPQLLDPKLEEMMVLIMAFVRKTMTSPPQVAAAAPESIIAFRFLGHLTKVRGDKVMLRYLPHEVQDLKPVLGMLEAQDLTDFNAWAMRYMLLLWLVILSQNPFELKRFDSSAEEKPVVDRLFDVSSVYLEMPNQTGEVAATLRARLVTRNDVKGEYLEKELKHQIETLKSLDLTGESEGSAKNMHKATGICGFLAQVLKHGQRADLLPHASWLLAAVESLKLHTVEQTHIRKYGIKLVTRIGLIFLKPRVAGWRYKRGNRSIVQNLAPGAEADASAKSGGDVRMETEEKEDEDYDVPEDIETVIDYLLTYLKDRDTVVRWSSAKGIGRITSRLPRELADEVLSSLLELFTLRETDAAWHGGCLALAELGRRGFLLPSRLPDVIPVVTKSLVYEEQQGAHSVGNNVRDAACYLAWSFARAYDPAQLAPYVQQLASALILVTIYDREVNCRRAASAAFQENVGRQGSLPKGIEILTVADYFAVGQRAHCYRDLSVFIAGFPEYAETVIEHLLTMKVNHWDQEIRQLTAEALGNLTTAHSEQMIGSVLPRLLPLTVGMELFARQGSLFAISHISSALMAIGKAMEPELVWKISSIPSEVVQKVSMRGMGADLIRIGLNQFIKQLSNADFPITSADGRDDAESKLKVLTKWLAILKEQSLKHTDEDLRIGAADAICAMAPLFIRFDPQRKQIAAIVSDFLNQINTCDREIERMAGILALGVLPPQFMGPELLKKVGKEFARIAVRNGLRAGEKDKTWAESRRDCVNALGTIYGKLCDLKPEEAAQYDIDGFVLMCIECYVAAMEDYTVDQRGDIGKVVREAVTVRMRQLILSLSHRDGKQLDPRIPPMVETAVCKLIQQCGEKIDSTRKFAGESMTYILRDDGWMIEGLPDVKKLREVFPVSRLYKEEPENADTGTSHASLITDIKWMSGTETFPRLRPLLSLPTYRYNSLLGFIISAGGLTESTMKAALKSLIAHVAELAEKGQQDLQEFLRVFGQIFVDYKTVDRVASPLLTVLDQILSYGYLECFVGKADSIPELQQLLDTAIKVTANKKNPQKVIKGVVVCCGYLQFETTSDLWNLALTQIIKSLGHKYYPFVRRETADKFYQALLTYGQLDNHNEVVMNILAETNWDAEAKDLVEVRTEIASRFRIDLL